VLDTRSESFVGYSGGKPAAGQVVEIAAPPGAAAMIVNVTGLDADREGYVTAYPCGAERPVASNLNLTPGVISPNLVISKVGANGKVCVYTQHSAHLVADLLGMVPAGSDFVTASPQRVLDTRPESPIGYAGAKPSTGQTIEIVAPPGARAVVLNLTGVDAEQDGFVTVYPCGTPMPLASNLNLTPGRITPNLTITKVGTNGKVCVFTQRSAHLVADLAGYFVS
jgi:hypothetical protein